MKPENRAPFAREASYSASCWLYLRGLGLVSLIAFISMWSQAEGLFLSEGIAPAHSFLAQLSERATNQQWNMWELLTVAPTVFWANSSDTILTLACAFGCVASLLLCMNLWVGPALLLCWLLYLSVVTVVPTFFNYQWDALLIESLFLGLFVAPWGKSLSQWQFFSGDDQPSYLAWSLQRFLLFKLILLSGLVKLWSNDAPWFELSATQYHYWTQPLPNPLSYWAHRLPEWAHQASCGLVLVIELGTIWLVFFGPRLRTLAFWTQVLLQLMIALTGNFGFFNILTIVLCITALDDRLLPNRLHLLISSAAKSADSGIRIQVPTTLRRVCLSMLIAMHIGTIANQAPYTIPKLDSLLEAATALRPLRSLNSYGLFANMTEERPEIIIEGSEDGVRWQAYEFQWKPGTLNDIPPWVTPHMPRLDWQMWFAALQGDCRRAPWFIALIQKILEGNQSVLAQLHHDPFSGRPPRYLRSTLYQYRFTTPTEHEQLGNYWHRSLPRAYCPTAELVDGQLERVERPIKRPEQRAAQVAR